MSSHRRRFLGFPFMFVLACSSDPQDSSSGDAAVEAGATDAAQASDVVLGTDGPLLQDGGGTAPADASTDGGPLCTTVGWCRLTGTKLTSVQPSPLPVGEKVTLARSPLELVVVRRDPLPGFTVAFEMRQWMDCRRMAARSTTRLLLMGVHTP